MKKSVVIIGKGPSVLKSKKEFIDSFDEVAICNFPPMDGYEKYIGTRATHHFLNMHDPNPYKKETLCGLGLKYAFNTNSLPHDGFLNCFPKNTVSYFSNYGEITIPKFENEYGFDPSCGMMAFEYFITKSQFW